MPPSRPPVLAACAAAAFALFAAGCGGSGGGSQGVATLPSTTAAAAPAPQAGLGAFASCMRSHGVRDFPDPGPKGGIPKPEVVAAVRQAPHRFLTAQGACSHLLPGGSLGPPETEQERHVRLEDELSFARCMRSHGVARFPDPTAQGELSLALVQAQGIDVHSTAFLRVVQACLPASHGALTPAKVREAIASAGGG